VVRDHAGCHDVEFSIVKLQFCRIHYHEAHVRVRRAGPSRFDLSGIYIDSGYVQAVSFYDFECGRADAASDIQVPPRAPDIDPIQQSLRTSRDSERMLRTIDEMFLDPGHSHV
jgi:hypothetical protein